MLFSQRPKWEATPRDTFTQPRLLWVTERDPRWLRKVKTALTTLYYRCARTYRSVSRWLAGFRRWLAPFSWLLALVVLAVTAVASAVLSYRMWRLPGWVLADMSSPGEVVNRVVAYRSAQSSILAILVQAVGGLLLLGGLFLTWRQLIVGQEAQISERFTRYVEQLANERVDVRVGAVHGLERLALDRQAELESVLTLLTAFALERARTYVRPNKPHALPHDLQIALAALIRFQARRMERSGSFRAIQLRGIDLSHAELSGVDFSNFDLRDADFYGAVLDGASVAGANLEGARFDDASMSHVNMVSAFFEKTSARRANLRDAVLRRAVGKIDLQGADLTGADLEWARLNADFRGAVLDHALFWEATFNFPNFENVDLRTTRGLYDEAVGGMGCRLSGAIWPGKTRLEAYKEQSGRDYS